MRPIILDKTLIIKLYRQNLNDKQIAKIIGVSKNTIARFRNIHNLPPIQRIISKKKFLILYNKGLNDTQIARKLNVSIGTARNYRVDVLKLKSIYTSEQRYNYFDLFKDKKVLEVFIGTLFGDASLYKFPQGGNISGMFGHSSYQKDYLIHKRNLMLPICNSIQEKRATSNILKTGRIINGNISYTVNFKSNPQFNFFYNEMYPDCSIKNTITKNILQYFTAHSLAIFFMDDGYTHISGSYLCTDNFKIESINLFRKFLYDNWQIETSIHGKRIYIKANSKQKFISIIEPYMIESLKYKIKKYHE